MQTSAIAERGAYGLRVAGLPDPTLLVELDGVEWPAVHVSQRSEESAPTNVHYDEESAFARLVDGSYAAFDRGRRSAEWFSGPPSDQSRLIHPFLAAVGAIFGRWDGREPFHGGAFLSGEGAWAFLGTGGSGKSSMLAKLHLEGFPILADDLLVLRGETVFAGPRFVDLRPAAAESLGVVELSPPARGGQKRRFRVGPVRPEVPLAGWVFLSWGPELTTRRVPPAERLGRLAEFRWLSALPLLDGAILLSLASLPVWEIRRPSRWDSITPAVDLLEEITAD